MVVDHDHLGAKSRLLQLLLIEYGAAVSAPIQDMLIAELPFAEVVVAHGLDDYLVALLMEREAILVDLLFCDVDGVTLVAGIHDACPNTALVVLNGPPDRDFARRVITGGADDYLVEGSYDGCGLAAAVLYAVERTRAKVRGQLNQGFVDDVFGAVEGATCAVAADGTIISVNSAWQAFIVANGDSPRTFGVGTNYLAVCDGVTGERSSEAAQVAEGLRAVLAGRSPRFELDYRRHALLSMERWFTVRISPSLNRAGAVISHHDVSSVKFSERGMAPNALHSTLTVLPNRALLDDRFGQALAERRRSGHLIALAFVDIDRFQAIDDNVGQSVGDAVLVEVVSRLAPCMRAGDMIARFAGDRLVVLWRDLTIADEAHHLSERLTQVFEVPFIVDGVDVAVSASIGVAIGQWEQMADVLLMTANTAMYEAKQPGSGLVSVLVPELKDGAVVTKIRTAASLQEAMNRDELVLHYQPVVDLTRGTVTGVEALVRWHHPTDGLLGPDLFIPVAEASGQIVALGAWVMEKACTQAMRWIAQGLNLEMAVNVSTRQIAHPDLIQTLRRILGDTGMEPGRLVLEVTESVIMEDAEVAATVLKKIGSLGVSLAIDDFGTGYSSLLYLKRYPIRALKVDRSFVGGMGINPEDDAIVASVIELGRAVGGSCIAEGIETYEQYVALRAIGCDYGQGWFFGKAVPAEEIPGLVARCEIDLATLLLTMSPVGPRRDTVADKRDTVADKRDTVADKRDTVADKRDTVADERDTAKVDRGTGANKRTQAELERDTAKVDRGTGANKRTQAELERDTAHAALTDATGSPAP
ncbi:MAG: putative bifunctional diguanylate cyclase/phosphodiesterase [Ferrimicrobium sp.]